MTGRLAYHIVNGRAVPAKFPADAPQPIGKPIAVHQLAADEMALPISALAAKYPAPVIPEDKA